MQTLLLLGAAYLFLAPKSGGGQGTPPPPPPPQATDNTGRDLGAAFGAFVASLISEASSSSNKP